jgi:hypothetical protein
MCAKIAHWRAPLRYRTRTVAELCQNCAKFAATRGVQDTWKQVGMAGFWGKRCGLTWRRAGVATHDGPEGSRIRGNA